MPPTSALDIATADVLSELSSTLDRVQRIADYARSQPPTTTTAGITGALSQAADLLTVAFSQFDTCSAATPKRPLSRGGLAGWQIRALHAHIQQHIGDRIMLADLAIVARISGSYLCRAF